MESHIHATSLLPEEIFIVYKLKEKYRASQIFKWISSGVSSFAEMTNLSKDLRESLSEIAPVYSTTILNELHDPDGTIKLQLGIPSQFTNSKENLSAIESVLLNDIEERRTACISTQVGCPMKCAFCQTGQLGFLRNLDAGEIVEQFYLLEKISSSPIDNVVFMGMGEPLLNLSNVRKAIKILTSAEGRGFSHRRFTLSTCGIIPGIYDLADNGPEIRLAISLTTANSILRDRLMPVNLQYPLFDLKKALQYFTNKTGKRITLEAALLHNVNTSIEACNELITFSKDINCLINLIPWNPISSLEFEEPNKKEINNFVENLKKSGIQVTLRQKRGRKIGGACGQLGKINKQN